MEKTQNKEGSMEKTRDTRHVVACFNFENIQYAESLFQETQCELQFFSVTDAARSHHISQSSFFLYNHIPGHISHMVEFSEFKKTFPSIPLIITSTACCESSVIGAMRARAWDYIVLPRELDHFKQEIKSLLSPRRENRQSALCPEFSGMCPLINNCGFSTLGRTDKAIRIITTDFGDKLKVEALATACQMHVSTFSRLFKIEHGVCVREYIKSYRLHVAKQLLRQASLTVQQIAHECGFEDASYFNRQFKQAERLTPTAYREKIRVLR